MWDPNEMNIDNVFSFTVATRITNYFETKNFDECRQKYNWPQQNEAIKV